MATFTPSFSGVYSNGRLIYNATTYTIGDDFKKYVESMEIVYDDIHDRKLTGFDDTRFLLNSSAGSQHVTGSISLTLVGDLPHWLMQQLTQLAKAVMGGGMMLLFADSFCTYDSYYCKWVNASDFVENNAVLAGGNMALRFYQNIG